MMTLGIGWYAAGYGPAGYAPVIPAGAPRVVRAPDALKLDGPTKDYLLDDDGFYQSVHPVDQQVALAMIVSRGAIAAVPELGNQLRTIRRVSKNVAIALAKSFVREALDGLVASKSIKINDVQIDADVPGRLFVQVMYTNLELSDGSVQTANFSLAYS
jgi:hypothetical protein